VNEKSNLKFEKLDLNLKDRIAISRIKPKTWKFKQNFINILDILKTNLQLEKSYLKSEKLDLKLENSIVKLQIHTKNLKK
jgi:hypothetical protein